MRRRLPSFTTSSRKARVCGFDRIGPIGVRIDAVHAERPTRNAYFSHSALRMSVESSACRPARSMASSSRFARGDVCPSYSPNTTRCNGPIWRMTPGPCDRSAHVRSAAHDRVRSQR